jgi:hypothetical protein
LKMVKMAMTALRRTWPSTPTQQEEGGGKLGLPEPWASDGTGTEPGVARSTYIAVAVGKAFLDGWHEGLQQFGLLELAQEPKRGTSHVFVGVLQVLPEAGDTTPAVTRMLGIRRGPGQSRQTVPKPCDTRHRRGSSRAAAFHRCRTWAQSPRK